MKVVLLAPTPPPAGGIAAWTVRMQKATLKNGWKVEVVDEKLLGKRDVFGENSKRKLYIEIKRCLRIWRDLIKALYDNDVKVVHSCIPATLTGMLREYICAIITKLRKRKFIIHYRCTIPNMVKNKMEKIIFKLLSNISDLVIVLNSPSETFVKKNSRTQVVLIPNFIEESSIKDKNVVSTKINKILYVGGVIETKGCFDIIEVAREFPSIQFRLVGKPDKKIFEREVPSNVFICGEKNSNEVKKEMEEADLFMFVSYFEGEGFSNALLEAMANGLPCIVSDWAANRDMIEDSGGIIVNKKDVSAMIDAIKKLEYDQIKRQSQSDWNIKKVKAFYSEKIVTEMYVDVYEKILNK